MLNSNTSSQHRPTNGRDRLAGLRQPSKFRGSHLGFFTAATSLNGSPLNFARCLAVCWAGILYIHFWGLLPPNGILPGAKFTLRSPVLAALLHSTGAVGISHTLRYGTRNGIMELSLLIIFNRGRHQYSEGGHHVGHRPTFYFVLNSLVYMTVYVKNIMLNTNARIVIMNCLLEQL